MDCIFCSEPVEADDPEAVLDPDGERDYHRDCADEAYAAHVAP